MHWSSDAALRPPAAGEGKWWGRPKEAWLCLLGEDGRQLWRVRGVAWRRVRSCSCACVCVYAHLLR